MMFYIVKNKQKMENQLIQNKWMYWHSAIPQRSSLIKDGEKNRPWWLSLFSDIQSYSDRPLDQIDNKIKVINKAISDLKRNVKWKIDYVWEVHWNMWASFVDKPIYEYTDFDKKIADMNPDLYQTSLSIDDDRKKMMELENNKINLQKALNDMKISMSQQKDAVNKSADESNLGIAQQKDIQLWAAQWMAGNRWATPGMLSNAAATISNKFAPQRQQVEAQRQQWLQQVAQQEANIPSQMAALQSQDISNQATLANIQNTNAATAYQKALLNKLRGSYSNKKTTSESDIPTENKDNEIPNYI